MLMNRQPAVKGDKAPVPYGSHHSTSKLLLLFKFSVDLVNPIRPTFFSPVGISRSSNPSSVLGREDTLELFPPFALVRH